MSATNNFLNKEISVFGRSFGDKQKERFYADLHLLFDSGVDIRTMLELIADEQEKDRDRQIFIQIKESVIRGTSLSQAMLATNAFSHYEVYSIQIGEETGRLTEILQELSVFFAKKIKQKRQMISALSYPTIVFVACFGVLFFMLKFVIPMFSDVFRRFKGELPFLTRQIIRASHFVSSYSLIIFLLLVVVFAALYMNRKSMWFRKYGAEIVLRLPVMKDLMHKIYLARFCQSMNLLISARTPLVTSLEMTEKMVGFYPIESTLADVRQQILRGAGLHQSLGKYKIFPKRMISLIKVAEEVNQLDAMFAKMARQYSDDVEHKTSIMGSLVEPVMIVVLGGLVALILVAMYLPLFQMSNVVG